MHCPVKIDYFPRFSSLCSVAYNDIISIYSPKSTSATRPIVIPKKLMLFCPLCNSISIKSNGRKLFCSAPIAEFSADHVDPRLFKPSKGWPRNQISPFFFENSILKGS